MDFIAGLWTGIFDVLKLEFFLDKNSYIFYSVCSANIIEYLYVISNNILLSLTHVIFLQKNLYVQHTWYGCHHYIFFSAFYTNKCIISGWF